MEGVHACRSAVVTWRQYAAGVVESGNVLYEESREGRDDSGSFETLAEADILA